MYCPEHILINNKLLMLSMYGSKDIRRRFVPIRWWINPLRYELIIRWPKYFRINDDGMWNVNASNFFFKLRHGDKLRVEVNND